MKEWIKGLEISMTRIGLNNGGGGGAILLLILIPRVREMNWDRVLYMCEHAISSSRV